MGAVRIRWRALAKVAALIVGAVVALQALPGMLKPPAPPPLAEDVGLPRISPAQVESRGSFRTPEVHKEPRDRERQRPARGGRVLPPDVISSVPHRHVRRKPREEAKTSKTKPHPSRTTVPPSTPPTPEPSTAPPAPTPAEPPPPASAPPSAPPPPPSDGSEEFAPH